MKIRQSVRPRRLPRCALQLAACAVVCLALPASAFALMSTGSGGWQWLDPQPQGNDLEAAIAVDVQHAIIGGDNGTLLTTTDGGATWSFHVPGVAGGHVASLSNAGSGGLWATVWSQRDSGNRYVLAHSTDGGATWTTRALGGSVWTVDFVDADHGWARGDDTALRKGGVWATSDGGLTWTFHAVRDSWGFTSIDFVDASHGWAAGDTVILDDPNAGSTGAIFATSDGGVTWHKQPLSSESSQMNTVSFVSAQDGWACGNGSDMGGAGTLVATTDGGAHWTAQSAGGQWDLSGVTFVDANHGWQPEGGSIYATTDGGATWVGKDSGLTSVTAVSFADDLDGYAVGPEGGIATTTDGGATWQARTQTTPAGGLPLPGAIAFPDPAHGWLAGAGRLLSTVDGGLTWSSQTLSAAPDTLSFPDAIDGWATGHTSYPSNQQVILHTSDTGLTWQTQYTADARTVDLTSIEVRADGLGWVAGSRAVGRYRRPTVGITSDGGAHWHFVTLRHVNAAATSVYFADRLRGWIACARSTSFGGISLIYRTTDGGRTWRLKEVTKRGIILRSITFIGGLRGWAVGRDNASGGGSCVVLTTPNGGRTWSMRRLAALSYYAGQQVVFTDGPHGWIACGPVVYATTDGGRHWQAQRPGSIVTALAFTDAAHGWAAAETADWLVSGGGVLATTTGGFAPGP